MSEVRLLALVSRYPHPTALARKVQDGALFVALRSLERRGFLRRHRGQYRLTRRGRDELAMARAIARLVARAAYAAR
jgi:DNA-binding PadR family transcriptional regulator